MPQSTPTIDSVKAAHSRLSGYGLFGDLPVDATEPSSELPQEGLKKNGDKVSNGSLFKVSSTV